MDNVDKALSDLELAVYWLVMKDSSNAEAAIASAVTSLRGERYERATGSLDFEVGKDN